VLPHLELDPVFGSNLHILFCVKAERNLTISETSIERNAVMPRMRVAVKTTTFARLEGQEVRLYVGARMGWMYLARRPLM
jgi:hypothetical protein